MAYLHVQSDFFPATDGQMDRKKKEHCIADHYALVQVGQNSAVAFKRLCLES